jgi:hypothetical protein
MCCVSLQSIDAKNQKIRELISKFLISFLEVMIKNNVTVTTARPALSNA